jgi:hypothetical protein
LPGKNIVQIGISDFANSKAYADRANENGVHVVYRDALRKRPISDVMAEALDIAGSGGREIYVDLDVDVCDRSVAPACPASVPGGISADELRQAAHLAGSDSRVRAIDITEIDASNGNLQNLKSFIIGSGGSSSNPLKKLPESISKLQKLEEIFATNCKLESLPELFVNLKNLETLDLSMNKISKLSKSIKKIEKMETLNLKT